MKKRVLRILFLIPLVLLYGCGAMFNQPVDVQDARLGEISDQTKTLQKMPLPDEPIVVGVYNFKDQTGQYKAVENGSTFSTAVTQGATTILIKALEDSKWFNPIERENLSNLLNERNIIRSTRDDFRKANPDANIPRLKPLLFAGILLEGGVISYDTNILTGGAGARYFGVGGSTQYRQDRITVYLRAVSTSNGAILKTVYVSKTILSQAVDVSLFRYVNFQRLLEVETGFTKNEPTQLAVSEAIEKAVEALIIEGIMDGLWSSKEGAQVDDALVSQYRKEKEIEASTVLYERQLAERSERKNVFNFSLGGAYIDGDFSSSEVDANFGLGYQYKLSEAFRLGVEVSILRLNANKALSRRYWWLTGDLNVQYRILPYDRFSPILYVGGGYMSFVDNSDALFLQPWEGFFKVQGGFGFEYTINPKLSLIARAAYHVAFSDKLDDEIFGSRDDHYATFGLGLNYHFGGRKRVQPTNEILNDEN